GVARLRHWGLLDRVVGSGCPPIVRMTADWGEVALTGAPPPWEGERAAYSPRRTVLDSLLAEAAVAAGAELRQGFAVTELLREGDRVAGVRGQSYGGANVAERGRVVVGADGRRSTVARLVGAAEYDARPALTCAYYGYWSGVPIASGTEFETY